jgi:Acetyl-CoA hydrolase
MAQELRYGFMGKVNTAIIEACEITEDGKIYLTAAGGISPTACRLADKIIVELNSAQSPNLKYLHAPSSTIEMQAGIMYLFTFIVLL